MQDAPPSARLDPWTQVHAPLLRRLMGEAATTAHLGGPESEEQILERQAGYERSGGGEAGHMFAIIDEATGRAAGSVGYWGIQWKGERAFETGWMILSEMQGRGLGAAGARLALERARAEPDRPPWMLAFPGVDNAASNAICRKLGFELVGPCEVEFPKGRMMRVHEWRMALDDAAVRH